MRLTTTTMAALAAATPLLFGGACTYDDVEQPSVETVEEWPSAYAGERLTLSGEVDDVREGRAFELESEEDLLDLWGDGLLVLTRSPVRTPAGALEEGDAVMASGTLRQLVVAEIEAELGWDLDPKVEAEHEGQPVLVADRVARVDELATWTEE